MKKNLPTSEYKKVACYIRVSTEEQAKEGYWLESQERILKAFIESNADKNWITSESLIYRDEGISWVAPVHERPALSRLKMDVLEGKIDILLIWKIDRLYRQTRLLLEFVEFLKEQNIGFVAKQEWIDVYSQSGKMMLAVLGAIAEWERDTIMLRTREGRLSKTMQGYYLGSSTPYGYKKEYDWRWNHLIIDEAEAKIVKEIFNLYVNDSKTTWEIAKILTARWIGTRKDNQIQEWSKKTKIQSWLFRQNFIHRILRSETYTGTIYYNKTEVKKDGSKSKIVEKDRKDWISIPCERIIDDKTWKLAQEKLEKWKSLLSGRWERHLYTGIIKCWICGYTYNYYLSHKWTANYRCGGKKKDKISKENLCTNGDVSEIKINQAVRPILEKMLQNAEKFIEEHEAREQWEDGKNRKNNIEKELFWINEQIKKKEEMKKNALRKSLENPEDTETFDEIIIDLKKEITTLQLRKHDLERELAFFDEREWLYESIRIVSEQYKKSIQSLSEEDWMKLTHQFVEKVIIEKDIIRVKMRVGKYNIC